MSIDYLMESEEEALRLELKTDASVVRAQAGSGRSEAGHAGSRYLLRCRGNHCHPCRYGFPGGHALGIDASPGRIQHARTKYARREPSLNAGTSGKTCPIWENSILCGSGLSWNTSGRSFDIVRNLASIVADGGILCLVDLDHNCLNHYGLSERLETALRASIAALEHIANFDPYAGRKLYSHLYRLGFSDIRFRRGPSSHLRSSCVTVMPSTGSRR
jgi:hypothetical protein